MRLTLYDVLEIPQDASIDVIRAAHRKLFLRYHPRANPGDAEAARTFQLINKAYAILFDPAERAQYDALAEMSAPPGFPRR